MEKLALIVFFLGLTAMICIIVYIFYNIHPMLGMAIGGFICMLVGFMLIDKSK